MFEIMKILRKDNYTSGEKIGISKLYPGCAVGFGFLPQKNISGCRMTVKTVNTYSYGDEIFLVYVLSDEEKEVNLIITRDDEIGEPVLSLSQRIDEKLFSALFSPKEPKDWFSMKEGEEISTSQRVMGMQQSWISPSYKLTAKGKGSFVEGDYRLRRRPLYAAPSSEFDYAILVDETNERALEVEKHEDGTLKVYATVYRPATDIGGITSPERRQASSSRKNGRAADMPGWREKNEWRKKRTADVIRMIPKTEETETKEKAKEKTEAVKAEAAVEAATATAIAEAKKPVEETKTPEVVKTQADVLTLDTKLATRVVHEAQRSNISITDMIRKVIDLPVNIEDKVMIAFSLSEEEQEKLAKRYKLAASDGEGVKKKIITELQQFIGDKQ